ncbi:MAG: hypothetical protein QNL11_01755, partial [Desulfobacterales bacterium]|nr:hypothetical protein [Desulfobacterales bacterium]
FENPNKKSNRFETVWNLRPARSCLAMAGGFICNLVLGICDFRHKTPRQGHYLSDSSNTGQAWHRGLGFSKLNKKTYGAICI